MINYSISLRANPSDQDAPKKAYANAPSLKRRLPKTNPTAEKL